jgi:hypothetical protein
MKIEATRSACKTGRRDNLNDNAGVLGLLRLRLYSEDLTRSAPYDSQDMLSAYSKSLYPFPHHHVTRTSNADCH